MNGYVETGYVVGLGVLAAYATSLVGRARAARRRLSHGEPPPAVPDAVSRPAQDSS